MYRIEATNPDGSQYTIYDPVGAGPLPVLGPRMSEELNEAGTLEFALVYGHPAFGLLEPKKTYVTVELDGTEIYYGRVVNADPSPMTGQIQYQCAGALSFLQDSEVPPDPKKSDGTLDSQTMTASAFLQRCINAHNADVGNDSRRTISLGTVSHSRKNEQREYQLNDYQDTKSVIEQNILNYYGGFICIHRDQLGSLLLDWVDDAYGDTDEGVLELGENIISLINRMNGENLYTAIRPVGKDNLVLSGGTTIDIFPSARMNEYGKIVKSVSFPDASTVADLQTKAQQYVNRLQKTLVISSDIKLLDMKFAGQDQHGVNLGDKYTGIVGLEGTAMLVAARNRDFENPQNDSCTLKNKRAYDGENSTERENSRGKSLSKRSSRNSSAAGYAYKHIHEINDMLMLDAKQIKIQGEQIEIHAQQLVETATEFARISYKTGELDTRTHIIEGTGVFQNSEHITSVAGQFRYVQGELELLNGTEFKIHDTNGTMITVASKINSLDDKTSQFEGSALWTQRNNITGIVGEFDIVTDPTTGKRTLVVKSGGGMKIRRDNSEFGLYDEGNLSGGILVDRLNDNSVITKIRGDKINLSTNDEYNQLVVDKNGIQQTVQNQGTTISNHAEAINGVVSRVSTIEGSALWTQRNNITGVVGEFDIVTNVSTGKRTLVVKSGGGLNIRRDGTDFGLYDEGSLSAGVIVSKINGGTATIQAKNIELNGTVKLNDVMTVISNAVGISKPLILSGNLNINSPYKMNLYEAVFQGSSPITLNTSVLSSMIKTAEKNGDIIRLTRFDNSYLDFNSATALISGAWSGRYYTVTADPQGASSATGIVYDGIVADYSSPITKSGKSVKRNFIVYSENENGGMGSQILNKELTIDASSVWTDGWAECYTTFDIAGTSASGTLGYGESATVSVKQKDASGNVQTRLSRTYTAPADRYNDGYNAGHTDGYNEGYTVSDIAVAYSGYSSNSSRYTLVSGSGESAVCAMAVTVSAHGYSEENIWYAPVQNAYRDGYKAGKGSGGSYASRNMRCTSVEQTHPGSSSSYYYFRLEGDYPFAAGTNYTFYRPSWH